MAAPQGTLRTPGLAFLHFTAHLTSLSMRTERPYTDGETETTAERIQDSTATELRVKACSLGSDWKQSLPQICAVPSSLGTSTASFIDPHCFPLLLPAKTQ